MSRLSAAGRWVAWGVLTGSAAGLVLGALGRFSPELDVIANGRGHLIGLLGFAVLALWLDYRPVLVVALGAFITLAGHALLAQQSQSPWIGTAQASSPSSLSVLSLNTWHNHPDGYGLADQLIAAKADVLVLTEFGPNKISLLHTLQEAYPYRVDCAADWECAVALLSRHPFASSGSVSEAEGNGPARAWITFGAGAEAFTIMGVHIMGPTRSPWRHARETAALADLIHQLPGEVLAAGDFNTTPWTSGFSRFSKVSGLTHMGRFLPTYPSGGTRLPQLAIDHMFATPAIHFDDVWLGEDMGSDHRPVFARITLPAAVPASGS